ncbi:MAG TPA: thiamine pyrophosphate-binding protein [Anaerolineales bacterium]|nr:thiamine pyrophosphate-binding protein [Anaerolineales bacterium]
MIKLSDYVVDFLVKKGITVIFMVSGGGIMHLVDSVGNRQGMTYVCNYHEQACAYSAEVYSRITGVVGACLVTTGPGGTNALSGVASAWVDSIPILVLSGQVRRDLIADYTKIRQRGPQEGNLIEMARPVTKYAVALLDPQMVRYELEKALYLATHGRPGPVWLDFPLDVQGAEIDETALQSFVPPVSENNVSKLKEQAGRFIQIAREAYRPLFLLGNGIHIARAEKLVEELLEFMPFPVVLPNCAKDLVPEQFSHCMGVFGTAGQRRANFAVQNADCVFFLASGINITKTGFNYREFAPKAKKILLDIDEGQLYHQAIQPDFAIQADINDFLVELLHQIKTEKLQFSPQAKWLETCARWKERYPIILDEFYKDKDHVNSYVFVDKLSDLLTAEDIVVAGNGLDEVSYWQAFKVKPHQRTIISGNWGPMGWDLPAAVGACIGGKRRTICLSGDGSSQWNVQELLTIKHYRLPIKVFIFNNHGYTNIRVTQANFFGRFVGADEASGVSNPNFAYLAAAYDLAYSTIRTNAEIEEGIRGVLQTEGPALCELNIAIEQGITPKASAFRREDGTLESRPLEDMAPFLPREEVWENMHFFDEDDAQRMERS